ncbi:MAG: nucleoside deaminase [Nitrospirales bacterium]|nr:nucleoside deaminase [Nitrospira sp.]MDR4501642.1 nucleoside deaminase [Nitrospirales bacterium]
MADRMNMILDLAQLNVKYQTGGPFAAGVFERSTHTLISAGVNLVTSTRASIAHAEIVAITLAQQTVGHHDLGADDRWQYELVTSTAPCAMCLGAIPWSGIRAVVCGARDEDARAIGFDEGDKPVNWIDTLQGRGISVTQDIGRKQAAQILEEYAKAGGIIYNGRQGTQQENDHGHYPSDTKTR